MSVGNRYRGKDLVVQWIWSGGTVTATGDQTSFDVDRSIDLLDATAGNVSDKEYINGLKDGTATLKIYDTGAAGSALAAALVEGNAGTLLYGTQGTTAGKPKAGFAAITKSHKLTEPFDKVVEIEVQFQKSGAMLYDYGSVWP